jgi:photosystem II stability/assembly factor-like uncharacterized protein
MLPPPFPVGGGVAPAPKQGVEVRRPARTGSVASMKLLAPDVGWAMSLGRLMWTSSGGTDWKDITPPGPSDALISAVFFLDASRGWVLFAHGEPDIPGGTQFDLASTDNVGATWTVEPLRMPDWLSGSLFNGGGWLAFADPNHGWLALGTGLTAESQGGAVLATSDGGKSWEYTDTPDSVAGPMVLVTPQFGWLVGGGAGNDELLVTRTAPKPGSRSSSNHRLKPT